MKVQDTPDLIYRDVDGFVKSVPVDNRCWPSELRQQRTKILNNIRQENTMSSSPRQPRPIDSM